MACLLKFRRFLLQRREKAGEEDVVALVGPPCCTTPEGATVMEFLVVQHGGPVAWGMGRSPVLGASLGPWIPPGIQEAGTQDHDSLAGALLELHLDGTELSMDDAHHALHLLGCHGPCAALLPQQVHDMGRELVTCLQWSRPLALGFLP